MRGLISPTAAGSSLQPLVNELLCVPPLNEATQ
jgi:hypothetical protein